LAVDRRTGVWGQDALRQPWPRRRQRRSRRVRTDLEPAGLGPRALRPPRQPGAGALSRPQRVTIHALLRSAHQTDRRVIASVRWEYLCTDQCGTVPYKPGTTRAVEVKVEACFRAPLGDQDKRPTPLSL